MLPPLEHFVHIEIAHPDPDAAASWMCEVLGAELFEEPLCRMMEARLPDLRVVHVRAGGIVFQFVKPARTMDTWAEAATAGPAIHNVTFTVRDLPAAREALTSGGAEVEREFVLDGLRRAGYRYEGDDPAVNMIDARRQVGVRFELLETGYGMAVAEPSHPAGPSSGS
jgi:hypothetical protein